MATDFFGILLTGATILMLLVIPFFFLVESAKKEWAELQEALKNFRERVVIRRFFTKKKAF